MSLTTAEEEKVRAIITAFDNGKTIDQLPLADTNQPSKYLIEGVSKETGESVKIPFADAVSIVNKHRYPSLETRSGHASRRGLR